MYSKPASIIPLNDTERIRKLYDYQILDTYPEEAYDKIALMAAQIFNTSSAFITFVDKDRVFFKSNFSSLAASEVDREDSLCSLAILQDDVLVFNNTHDIPELMQSPYVAADGGIRFYAGAPLYTPEGFNMGTICVIDSVQREASAQQKEMLKTLSRIVVDKLESRLRYNTAIGSQNELMNMALHEIKNPLASINLANDILMKSTVPNDKMTTAIRSSVKRIQDNLANLLHQSEQEEKELTLHLEQVNIYALLSKIKGDFELLAKRKKQVIDLEHDETLPTIDADKVKLSDIFHNLVSNAIKYSYEGATIKLTTYNFEGQLIVKVKDEGQGLSPEDSGKLFTKFARLSSRPTGKETSHGLGLSITKSLVELHKGTITAVSEGKERGTSFIVTLPLN